MLQKVRDRSTGLFVKGIMWLLVAAFVGTIFLVWGRGDQMAQGYIASVYGEQIPRSDFSRRYEILTSQLGGNMSPEDLRKMGLEKTVVMELVSEKLMQRAAGDMGITVSDKELQHSISTNPNFRVDGAFSKERYFTILKNNRLTPGKYEELQRNELKVNKLAQIISDSAQVTEAEVRQAFNRRFRQVSLAYFSLTAAEFENRVEVTEEEVAKFYDDKGFQFFKPESRQVEMITADLNAIKDTIQVSEEEARAYYQENEGDFYNRPQVHARHILVRLPQNATAEQEQALKKKAESFLAELKNGADFEAFAKKNSEGPSASRGGDLGFFERGTMVASFEKAAFALKPGEISDVVKTPFGFHIIKVEENVEAGIKPFNEVKEQIQKKLATEKAEADAREWMNMAGRENRAEPWKPLADRPGYEHRTAEAVLGEPLAEEKPLTRIVERAFEMKEGAVSSAMKVDDRYYIIRVNKIVEPHKMPLDEVSAAIKRVIRRQKAAEKAAEEARSAMKRIKDGASLQAVAADYDLEVKETPMFNNQNPPTGTPSIPEIREAAFALPDGGYDMVTANNLHYLIQVTGSTMPDGESFAEKRSQVRSELLNQKRIKMVQDWQQMLINKAYAQNKIKIKPEYL